MLIYRVRETTSGYFVDTKDKEGHAIDSYLVSRDKDGFKCSCESFQKLKNQYTHFHIIVVKKWLQDGKSPTARYIKDKNQKIQVLVD